MKNMILVIALLASSVAHASANRALQADTINATGGASIAVPSTGANFVSDTATQTLTNKTLTSPAISTPTGIVKGDVGLGNVDNTSDATKNAAAVTLTNKTLTSPVINTPTGIVKGDVGLGNVDNTSDATKNAATATLTNKTIDYNSNTILNLPSSSPNVTGSRASPTAIVAGTGVTFSGSNFSNTAFIAGSGGPVTVSATPQIAAATSVGQMLTLIGRSATNTVTLADGTGLSLNGSWVGGLDSVLILGWDGTNWVEFARR